VKAGVLIVEALKAIEEGLNPREVSNVLRRTPIEVDSKTANFILVKVQLVLLLL